MKGSTVAFLLEFGLFFVGAVGFGVWQLRSLKKLDEADAKLKKEEDAAAAAAEAEKAP